jgi:hypothetical protein
MGFIVKIGDRHFVKRTSRHGVGRGVVYSTDKVREARVWTRKADAEYGAEGVLHHRNCEWRKKYQIGARAIPEGVVEVVEEQ